jgi:competence protein ComEC
MMGSLVVFAPYLGRRYNLYTAMALTVLLLSSIEPFVIFEVSFLLSYLGTLGIILFVPYLHQLLHPMEKFPFGKHIVELSAVTIAAQVGTLPIFAATFQQISLVAPITNILTVPLFGVVITLGILTSCISLLSSGLGLLCGWVSWPVLWYISHVVSWCASWPDASISVGTVNVTIGWAYYAALGMILCWLFTKGYTPSRMQHMQQTRAISNELDAETQRKYHKRWIILRWMLSLMIVLATGGAVLAHQTQGEGKLSIIFLNLIPTGQEPQGESILVQTPDHHIILIDGGIDARALAQELDSRLPSWQRTIDTVILTSPTGDHLTGLQDILDRYQVGKVFDGGMLHPTATYSQWQRTISKYHVHYLKVSQGTTLNIGQRVALQVLWPGVRLHKGNNEVRDNTLVLRLLTPDIQILLLGTAAQSRYALTGLLTSLDSNYLQASIVQIVGGINRPFPAELQAVISKAAPNLLVVTPAELSVKQRKEQLTSVMAATNLPFTQQGGWQMMQTAQVGTIEISDGNEGWSANVLPAMNDV